MYILNIYKKHQNNCIHQLFILINNNRENLENIQDLQLNLLQLKTIFF